MKFNVTEIEFETDLGTGIKEEYAISFEEEIELRDLALGVWEAEDEDDLLEEITSACGFCIRSIDWEYQLKWH